MARLRHRRAADVAFAIICLLALAALLWLGSGLTFVKDEWALIVTADDWSFDALMEPHNRHFMPLLRLVWNALMATVGLRSYLPYLLVDYLFVVAAAAAIYVFARRQTHALIAIAAGTTFLLLGTGAENLFLAFQMGWTAAAAAGTWALVILLHEPRPKRPWLASVLLVLGILATGSFTLPFVAAAGAIIVIAPRLRRHWWVVLPPIAIFGTWFLAYGRSGGLSMPPLSAIVAFVENGLGHAVGRILAVGADIGIVLVVLLTLAALADAALSRRPRLGLVAGVVGLGVLWLLIAIGRAGPVPDTFTAPRYVHISGPFVLLAITGWLAQRRVRRPVEPLRLALVVTIIAAVVISWNVQSLTRIRKAWVAEAADYRAAIAIVLEHGGSPAIPDDRGLVRGPDGALLLAPVDAVPLIPGRAGLATIVEVRGSPLDDPLARGGTIVPDTVVDRAFARITDAALVVGPALTSTTFGPLDIGVVDGLEIVRDGRCVRVTPTTDVPSLEMGLTSGSRVRVEADVAGQGDLAVSLTGAFGGTTRALDLDAATPIDVTLPDIGPETILRLRLRPPPDGATRVCAVDRG